MNSDSTYVVWMAGVNQASL